MKFSIITPTEKREPFLKLLAELLNQQTYPDWEWLIYDTSLHPSSQCFGEKVTYHHSDASITLGEKRNRLIEMASGDVIVHCDDDDYYAPTYLETLVQEMKGTDFFHIHSWFSYNLNSQQCYYWSTDDVGETHFVLDSMTGMRTREIDFGEHMSGQLEQLRRKGREYGFTFAYRKEVAEAVPFGDLDVGEDRHFYQRVEGKGYRIHSIPDQKGITIHVIHHFNSSKTYPQYRIPHFLVKPKFPGFFSYLEEYPYEN